MTQAGLSTFKGPSIEYFNTPFCAALPITKEVMYRLNMKYYVSHPISPILRTVKYNSMLRRKSTS